MKLYNLNDFDLNYNEPYSLIVLSMDFKNNKIVIKLFKDVLNNNSRGKRLDFHLNDYFMKCEDGKYKFYNESGSGNVFRSFLKCVIESENIAEADKRSYEEEELKELFLNKVFFRGIRRDFKLRG